MRMFVIGLAVGAFGGLLWMIEMVRRSTERDRVAGQLWPRPDGSFRSYGAVWDIPATR
jgi:hypothetical protein